MRTLMLTAAAALIAAGSVGAAHAATVPPGPTPLVLADWHGWGHGGEGRGGWHGGGWQGEGWHGGDWHGGPPDGYGYGYGGPFFGGYGGPGGFTPPYAYHGDDD